MELYLHSPYKLSWNEQGEHYLYLLRTVFTAPYGLNFYTKISLKVVFAQFQTAFIRRTSRQYL